MKEIVKMLTGTTQLLTALLSAVAAVSLLVGGDRHYEYHAGIRNRAHP